ncbi:hypothetical protein [Verminephrobacter eiseniae]|uniref:hypothetical protein n=1 Tax=Verminephrobacter eiseniae TaxID=364317 RepID=UPI002237D3B2|nr:hypothetical protein [Verminephrobacter eiseniae]
MDEADFAQPRKCRAAKMHSRKEAKAMDAKAEWRALLEQKQMQIKVQIQVDEIIGEQKFSLENATRNDLPKRAE